jgi:hypothetical protein
MCWNRDYLVSRFYANVIRGVMESSSGAMNSAVMLVSFMKIFNEGPATSFKGSPTVSPTTAAVWVWVPLIQKPEASMLFFVLSHSAPPKVKKEARSAAVHVPPSSRPPSAAGPSIKPVRIGDARVMKVGKTIFFKAFFVLMSIHVS